MGYDYTCDAGHSPDCLGSVTNDLPAMMGDLNETWFKATPAGDRLDEAGFHPSKTVTICPPCTTAILLDAQ